MKKQEKKISIDINKELKEKLRKLLKFCTRHKSLLLIIVLSIAFSTWLMGSTFGYSDGNITMGDKLWSDFNSHLPLIRAFSMGDNTPLEYPLFSGEKIRYHFLFYFMVGMLEKSGLRIDLALNLLSIIGMAGLMISLYLLALKLTRSKFASWLSVLFLIFNASFSWIYFVINHPVDQNFLSTLISTPKFSSFGPYDDNIITAFWNLNIFTNQRHLAFSFFLMFLAIWGICYSKKTWTLIMGLIIIMLMPWLHKAILMILFINLGLLFISEKGNRKRIGFSIAAGILVALPGLNYLASTSAGDIKLKLGYIFDSITWKGFFSENPYLRWVVFWVLNLGLLPILSITGLILIEKNNITQKYKSKFKNIIVSIYEFIFSPKRIWFVSALVVFIIANTITFATDPATNHKLFNFSVMIFSIYAAYYIFYLFKKPLFFKVMSVLIIFFMILGGIVDLFPIINENQAILSDVEKNPTSMWIINNTDPKSHFFNATSDTYPISLTGRRLFFGGEYLNWSIGYPTVERRDEIRKLINGNTPKEQFCEYLKSHKLDYIFLTKNENQFVEENIDFNYFDNNFKAENIGESPYKIYNTQLSCS